MYTSARAFVCVPWRVLCACVYVFRPFFHTNTSPLSTIQNVKSLFHEIRVEIQMIQYAKMTNEFH